MKPAAPVTSRFTGPTLREAQGSVDSLPCRGHEGRDPGGGHRNPAAPAHPHHQQTPPADRDPAHLRHLGVPELDERGQVVRILEKPEDPPSRYGVAGIYFYDERVFEVIPTLVPSGRGELEITDVNNWYVDHDAMEYEVLEGFWGDAGESIDAYYAVNDFVRTHGANKG